MFVDSERAANSMMAMAAKRELIAKYRPWRKFRYVVADKGENPEDLWLTAKFARMAMWKPIGLSMPDGREFGHCLCSEVLEALCRIDRTTGGGGNALLEAPGGLLADEGHRIRIRIKTLMDEAIESSLIEGAATTRAVALEMLRSDRPAKTPGEVMVVNNYLAMQKIKTWLDRPLSKQMLLDLQAILTSGTLDKADAVGRFRKPDENVRVVDERTQEDIYVPPPAEQLEARVDALCHFANEEHTGTDFMHPIAKACILHFMIGFEHPFVDGNGRTARAVFYWYALRHGYNVFEFIPISEKIRKGFAKYPQAYLDTELDDGDLTYFILYKLGIIEASLDALSEHLKREESRISQSESLLKVSKGLNLRQRMLLEHALRHPMHRYTVKSHANSNGIVPVTARADLSELERLRLLVVEREGREVIYRPAPGLADRVAKSMRK